jgi:transcriptional regulator with XRE-family HTH domain
MPPHEDPQVGLGQAVRKLRTESELSQESLAFRSASHPTWIGRVEAGRVNPSWGSMRRIAAGLGVALPSLAALAEEFERKRRGVSALPRRDNPEG